MVRAATTGAFNFTGHDPFDTWWWRRLRWTMDELVRRNNFEYYSCEQTHNTALLASSRIETSDWEKNQQECLSLLDKMHGALFPWLGKEETGVTRTEANRLEQMWHDHFSDPDAQAKIAEGIAYMQQLAAS